MDSHALRTAQLRAQFGAAAGRVRLAKDTSNLFRDRRDAPSGRLDVRAFSDVLNVDPAAGEVDVEGMTPYSRLVDATLPHGLMPAVVPQLKSITIGGAISGVGIESSSFRYGLVHETIRELEVLTGTGEIVVCRPDNEHRDLYHGFPNSYGTLGYALRVRAAAVPVKPFVRIEHTRHTHADEFFTDLGARAVGGELDFLDGVAFAPDEMVMTTGRLVDAAPYASDYGYERIYYRSLRERREDYLATPDYLWRWDTDWFWCSKNVGAQNPLLRRLYGRKRLNSVTYTKIMRWNARWGLTRRWNRLFGLHAESVIQDVDIPLERAAEFLEFFLREVGIRPVWICPIGHPATRARFPLYPIGLDRLYVNFGFWDVVRSRVPRPAGYFNRRIEDKVEELGGIKSLYSDSFYDEERFWRLYNGPAYRALKARYDPAGRFPDLYRKCVLRE
jgi:FAD/FMN-containing dehydrogenase